MPNDQNCSAMRDFQCKGLPPLLWWAASRGWREGVWWDRGMNKEACELCSYTATEYCTGGGGGNIKNHFNESRAQRERRGETFWPHSKGRKSIFSQLCYCLQEYKCDDQKRSSLEAKTGTSSNVHQTDVLKLTGSYKKGVKGEQRCYETSVTAQFIPLQTVCIVKISSSLVRQMDASIWLRLWWWRYLFRNVSSRVLASNAKGKNELPQLQNDRRHQLQVVPHLSPLWTSDLVKILQ